MATIAEHLIALADIQSDIKTALVDKGIDMTNTAFVEYADKIGDIKVASGNAAAANVLEGKTFSNASGSGTGTMTDNGAVSKSITPSTSSQTYTIPAGYHNGSGKVTVAAAPTSLIDGDATTGNVLKGKTFFCDSYTKKTGTMQDLTRSSITHSSSNTTPVIVGDATYISTNSDGVQRVQFRTGSANKGYVSGNTLVARPVDDVISQLSSNGLISANYNGYTVKTGTLQSYSVSTKNSNRTITFPDNIIPLVLSIDLKFGSINSESHRRFTIDGLFYAAHGGLNGIANSNFVQADIDLESYYGSITAIPKSLSYYGWSTEASREVCGTIKIIKWLEPLNR